MDTTQVKQVEPASPESPLPSLSTKAVKSLYRRARSLRTLCLFWLLLIAMCVASISAAQPGSAAPVIGASIALLATATFFGMWRFQHWGRILGIVLCVLLLPIFPWGTIFGILGLAALVGSRPLFGEGRYSQEQLRKEIEHRKTSHVA